MSWTSDSGGDDGLVGIFGYGSLVNRRTLTPGFVAAHPARLSGWRRFWRPRPDMPGFPAALLSVRREAGAGMDGLLIIERRANLAAIDRREGRYRRHKLEPHEITMQASIPDGLDLFIYEAHTHLPLHRDPPRILRSYLDVCMDGFLDAHGEAGLARFLGETEGFAVPVHEDRAEPVYPRHLSIHGDRLIRFLALAPAIHHE
ncbi:MAG: gamma-glutamylcyclotransferase [Notoacmeibacter sp.]|nr:gamma-glutamylcyclotransferase [Notoacmeibacter sp.]